MKKRVYTLKLYLKDTPNPFFVENVWHIQTEGELLRLIIDGKSSWYPLSNVAYFKEVDMAEKGIQDEQT